MIFITRTSGQRHGSPNSLLLAMAALVVPLGAAPAQMLGVPVLQNAYANPGFTVAVNAGGEPDAQTYGGAVAWSPGGARFQVSVGAGSYQPDETASATTYGGRVMVPLMGGGGGAFGVGGFVGAGGASRDGVSLLSVPLGMALGYRHAFGSGGASVYAAPFFSWTRASGDNVDSSNSGVFRVSVGLDVGLFRSVGITGGVELGATADDEDPGPSGTRWGVGLSYAFGGG